MFKYSKFILFIIISLFLIGCGGGNSSGSEDNNSNTLKTLNLNITLQKNIIDVSNKQRIEITTDNAQELFELVTSLLPKGFGINSDEYQASLKESNNTKIDCDNEEKGTFFLSSYSDENLIDFQFYNCLVDDILIDGLVAIKFNSKDEIGQNGTFYGKNVNFSDNENNVSTDFLIEFNNTYQKESRKFYVKVIDNNLNKKIELNLKINTTQDTTNISGIYLLENDTYFTISSKNLTRGYFNDLIALDGEAFFDEVVKYGINQQIVIAGNNSKLNYSKKYGKKIIFELQNTKYDFPFYSLDLNDTWNQNIEFFLNDNLYTPYINYNLSNVKELSLSNEYINVTNSPNIHIKTLDINPIANHKILIKLLDKPSNSNLDINETFDLNIVGSNDDNLTQFEGSYSIVFDQDGWYTFDLHVFDYNEFISYTDSTFKIYYSKAKDIDDKVILSSNVSNDIVYYNESNNTIVLDRENKQILFINNLDQTAKIDLDLIPSNMILLEDNKTLVVNGESKVYTIALDNNNSITSFEMNGTFEKLVAFESNIFMFDREQWNTDNLVQLNIESKTTKRFDVIYDDYLLINKEFQSLYMIDNFGTSVTKFKYQDNNLTKAYNEFLSLDGRNFWFISNTKLLTNRGIIYNITDTNESSDIQYSSSNEIISLKTNSVEQSAEMITGVDINQNKNMIALSLADNDNELGLYPRIMPRNNVKNTLKLINNLTYDLIDTYNLQNHVMHNQKIYRTFVSNIKMIENNKVFILYLAKANDDDSFYFYDVVNIKVTSL